MHTDFSFGVDDALDVVSASEPAFNDDGSLVGFLRFHRGETDFAAVPVEDAIDPDRSLSAGTFEPPVRTNAGGVDAFEWRPNSPDEAAIIVDGAVHLFDAAEGTHRPLASTDAPHSAPAWSPDGSALAYLRDGRLWIHDVGEGSVRDLTTATDAPSAAEFFGGTELAWSPDGRYVATILVSADETLGPGAFDVADETLVWDGLPDRRDRIRASFAWVGDDLLTYAEDAADGASRTYRAVTVGTDGGRGSAVASESYDRILFPMPPTGNDDGLLAIVSPLSGYRHLHVVDVPARRSAVAGDDPGLTGPGITRVTAGEYEARGGAADAPAWSADGRRLAYAANPDDPGERQLYVATVDGADVTDVVGLRDVRGSVVWPTWDGNDRVACVRSGRTTPPDVHVADVDAGTMARVTAAHPRPETFADFPDPDPVSFRSADGRDVYGYLYAPPDAAPGDERPAVLFCHGGPTRQMRRGFSHVPAYTYFHAFDHVLVDEGYVVMELNYRGGIGYGSAFERGIYHAIGVDEVADCVAATRFLRDHDLVGDRVGVWGNSYGGFLATLLATKTDAVDASVSVAGIWNWNSLVSWSNDLGPTHWGPGVATWFYNYFGGPPDDEDPAVRDRYARASPSEYVDRMDTPLLALHGSGDEVVTVAEQDALVRDAVAAGAPFEMIRYPDEAHTFERPETWADALDRVSRFFAIHLSSDRSP